ncbi:transposase [Streptomyces sp. SID13666]|uniref:transposase n=1 Tax=Streptomyces sp. SID13666 TaxID=2706054 RepID=UPI001EF1FA87|nr:transposase [Streptomyces sp. SID13666]
MAPHPFLDPFEGPGFRGKRTRVGGLYTCPPEDATVVCVDELGPVIPRTFPRAPGWSPDGHRIKAQLDYSRGPEKTWVYGGLRVRDGQQVTMTASSRNSVFYQQFLQKLENANPNGDIYVITDNLSSHNSLSTEPGSRTTPVSGMSSYPSAPAGSTCKKAGGASSAKLPSPDSPSPDLTRSPKPPHSQQPSSTPVPDPGSGADLPHPPDTYAAGICTAFKESSTRSFRRENLTERRNVKEQAQRAAFFCSTHT